MIRMILIALAPFLLGALSAGAQEKDAPKKRTQNFTIGKDTTHVVGPLDKDGRIDYGATLNERLRQGVTPANNANVLIWKAFGRSAEGSPMSAKFFEWMQMPMPPEKGDYFVTGNQFLKEHLKVDPREASERFHEAIDKASARPWTAKDYPEVADWLKANQQPLAVVIEASKRTHYYSPFVPAGLNGSSELIIGSRVSGVQQCRQLGRALTARAMLNVAQGRPDDAWQDLLACHRLGRLVARGGCLIEAHVGMAIETMAFQADVAFLDAAKLDAAQLKKCLVDLKALPPMPPMADKMNQGERFMFLDCVMFLDRDGAEQVKDLFQVKLDQNVLEKLLTRAFFASITWDTALRNGNRVYDRFEAAMRIKDRAKRMKQLNALDIEIRELKGAILNTEEIAKTILGAKDKADAKGKYLGDMLTCLIVPAVVKSLDRADSIEQNQRNLQTAFALAAYKNEYGRYPKSLDALAPKYLASVPNDVFSGKAPIYRPAENGFLLYSVGVNGKDEQGRGPDDAPAGDDLRVRLPLRK